MLIIHDIVICPNCNKDVYFEQEDAEHMEVDCPYCGYTVEFTDTTLEFKEIEW